MRCGVPVVSTRAPYGPAEILADDVDGILTPVGDADAMGAALLRVISDDEKRRAMAEAALKNSERYDPDPIAEQYERLFAELAERKARRRGSWWARLLPRRAAAPVVAPPLLGPAPTLTVPTATAVVRPGGAVDVERGPALADGAVLVWRQLDTAGRRLDGADEVALGEPVPAGNWQLFTGDGAEVQAGALDTRALIGHRPEPGADVLVRLPYRLTEGGVGLRVWHRPMHAEVGDVQADSDGVHVDVETFGVPLDGTLFRLRGPQGQLIDEPLDASAGSTFRVTVPALDPGVWGLWLHTAAGDSIRFGRFLDDVARKNFAHVLPAASVGEVTVQPYYELNNEFSVRVTT
jgi:hypothetical protein